MKALVMDAEAVRALLEAADLCDDLERAARTLEAVCAAMGGKETRAEYYLPAFSLGLMQLDSARCKLADVLNTALKEQQGVQP